MKLSRIIPLLASVAILGLSVALISHTPPSEAAFGTSPPWVRNDHMLPGTSYEQVINLSRNNPDKDMKVNVKITGDKEIQNWLKIENQNRLIMKQGEVILPMKVIVEVPKRAALRDYRGGLFVTLEPIQEGEKQGGTVAITLGANISVEISVVGTKVTQYRIQSISTQPLEEGQSFSLAVELENQGNTEIASLNGQVDIYDEKETQVLKTLTFGSLEEPISPDQRAKVNLSFGDFSLEAGAYWLQIKAFKDSKIFYENRLYQTVTPKVVPVITPEDALAKKPSVPKIPSAEETLMPVEPLADLGLKPVAPVPASDARTFIIFGYVGLGFGFVALIGLIAVLVLFIRNQRQANIERYLANQMRNNPH